MPELARFLHPEGDGAGDPAPAIAIAGLAKALAAVPNAPATRLALGTEPASRGVVPVARGTPMLVARGDHDPRSAQRRRRCRRDWRIDRRMPSPAAAIRSQPLATTRATFDRHGIVPPTHVV